MERFATALGWVTDELISAILIIILIALGVIAILGSLSILVVYKYWDLIMVSILVYLLWSNVIS